MLNPIASIPSITATLLLTSPIALASTTAEPTIAIVEHRPSEFSVFRISTSELPLQLTQSNEALRSEGIRLFNQAKQQFNFGQFTDALKFWQQALDIFRGIGDRLSEATVINRLGDTYYRLGQYENAIELYQQSLAINQETGDQKIRSENLTGLGNVYYSSGQYDRAIDFHQQALRIDREIQYRQGEAADLDNLGLVYSNLGQYQKAIDLHQQSLSIYQEIGERQGESKALGNLGNVYYRLGQYDRAIDFHQQSLAIKQEIGDRAGLARSFSNLGNSYYSLGQYDRAIDFHQKALAINREIGAKQEEAGDLGNLGLAYYSLGQYNRAIEFHQQALAINQEIGAIDGEALNLGNLGLAYYSLGQYNRAIEFYQPSISINQNIGIRQTEAENLNNSSLSYFGVGEYEQAVDFYQRALSIDQEIGDKQGESADLSNLGLVYFSLGDYIKAIDFYHQSLSIQQNIGDRLGEAISLNNIGSAYQNLKTYTEALRYYSQALSIFQEIGGRNLQGTTLSNIGYLFELQNQPELAISFYQQSVAVREGIRQDLRNLSQELQQSYTDTVADTYRSLANLLLAAGRVQEGQDVLELLKVSELQDYAETRTAIQTVRATDPSPTVPTTDLVSLNPTMDLIALGTQLVECEQRQPFCPDRSRLQAERDQANAVFNQNLQRLQAQIRSERANDPARLDPAELSRAARAIVETQPHTVLIYPLVLDDKLWLVWVAKAGAQGVVVQSREVPVTKAQLGQAVRLFRERLQSPDSNIEQVQQLSQRLYGWLIAPIRQELDRNGIEHLVFSLDRSTRYIPLAALFDGQNYLVQDFTISTILTAGLTDLQPPQAVGPVLAMGLSNAVAEQQPLPNVPIELKAIVGDNGRGGILSGAMFLNQQFNLESLKENLLNYRILHLATHGIFTSQHPEDSYLILGTGEKLTLLDIQTLRDLAGIDLVTLSACQTGLGGPNEEGIEVSGMSYFFLTSGAKAVLASLWSVSDESTSLLMQRFYKNLANSSAQEPVTKAEALRQAQLQVLQTPQFAHPFYWSPFYLVGNNF